MQTRHTFTRDELVEALLRYACDKLKTTGEDMAHVTVDFECKRVHPPHFEPTGFHVIMKDEAPE